MTSELVPFKPGSLLEAAGGVKTDPHTMAMALAKAEMMIVVDCSGSMVTEDAGDDADQMRAEAAQEALDTLQKRFPGRIAVGAFSSAAVGLCPTGTLPDPEGSTPMYDGLSFFYPKAITMNIKCVLISDGEPDGGHGPKCIALAQKHQYPIYCIYCGPLNNSSGGRDFMERLAKESGGQFDYVNLENIKLLTAKLAGYLTAAVATP